MASGHRWDEHTADLALTAWGDDEAQMLLEAGRAVLAMVADGVAVPADDRASVRLDALDPEDRLVRWLNEVLYLATVEGQWMTDGEIVLTDPGTLTAELEVAHRGADAVRSEIKSASYHALSITRDDGRVTGHVVLDV